LLTVKCPNSDYVGVISRLAELWQVARVFGLSVILRT
jgi:hypothetical protein